MPRGLNRLTRITAVLYPAMLAVSFSWAQQSSQTMTFSNGASIPVGNFARSKSIADRGAETGGLSEITYQYRRTNAAFGFVASARIMGTTQKNSYPVYTFSGQNNQPGFETTAGQLPTLTKSSGRIDDPGNYPGYITKLRQADLVAGAVMAGISYQFSFSKRWSLQEELQLGIARMALGKSTLKGSKADTSYPGNVDLVYSQWENTPVNGFSGVVKLAPTYRLNTAVAFFLSADYWHIHSHMTYVSDTKYGIGPVGSDASSLGKSLGFNQFSTIAHGRVVKNPAMISILFGIRVAL